MSDEIAKEQNDEQDKKNNIDNKNKTKKKKEEADDQDLINEIVKEKNPILKTKLL